MPRPPTRGTPSRSHEYLFPRPAYPLVWLSAVLAVVVAGSFLLFDLGGRLYAPLRAPLMPGGLVGQHSFDRCEACHAPLRGASTFRCQRCHDESGPGRMTHLAHLGRHYARLGDPAAAAPEDAAGVACVRCHVEHRGSDTRLVRVDDQQCVSCHGTRRPAEGSFTPPRITGFEDHPEFGLRLRNPEATGKGLPLSHPTGFYFSHRDHVQEVRTALPAADQAAAGEGQLCVSCHALGIGAGGPQADFQPLSAANHCFRCHAHDKHLKVRPAPVGELVALLTGGAPPALLSCDTLPRDFRCDGGQVEKTVVAHKDPWVLLNVRKLRRELYPEDHAREVAQLRERALRLRRRLYLAPRLAGLPLEELQKRREALVENVRDLAARVDSRSRAAGDPQGGVSRVTETAQALTEAQDPAGAQLQELVRALGAPSGNGPDPEFAARRQELIDLLDAVAAQPGLQEAFRRRVDVLRARVFALRPGEGSLAGLRRALAQRRSDLARVEDELSVRRSGVTSFAEPNTGLAQAAAALQQVQARLAELGALEAAFPPVTDPAARARKEAALLALTGEDHKSGCAKCHQIARATFSEPVVAAEPMLTLARFGHARHLTAAYPAAWTSRLKAQALPPSETATPPAPGAVPRGPTLPRCAYCHGDLERSESSQDLHLQPIADCRACHRAGAQRTDCQLCHLYHPPSPRRP